MGVKFTGKDGNTDPAAGWHSWLWPVVLTRVQGCPALGDGPEPDVHCALLGQVPELGTPTVPPMHSGHGWLALAVR
jgi:hypothetical protein